MHTEEKFDNVNEQRLQAALRFQQTDQADKALAQYRLILESYPQHAMITHLMGITLAQLDQLDEAIQHFKIAIDRQPSHPIYQASLANAMRRKGDTSTAIHLFEKALQLNPSLVSAHNNLALIYFSDQPEKARYHLEKAITYKPDHLDANFNLGIILLSRNPHKAKQCFSHVIELHPQHVPAMFQLAQLHHAEKANFKARTLYEKILSIQPDDPECLNKIGLLYLEQDQFDQGLKHLEKAYQLMPELTEIHHNLACCYLHQKQYQKALSHWLQYLKINQELDTYYNVGVCYLYLGRYDDCTDQLFHVIKQDPNHYKALINLGAAFLQKGHPEPACDYYTRAQAIHPTSAIAYILSALQQSTSPTEAPADYVTDLFNNYAFHYDNHLSDVLNYQVPARLSALIPELLHLAEASQMALDLGCGTGLSGAAIKPYCRELIGIDLSQNMLEQANRKALYDRTICANILTPQVDLFDQVTLILTADTIPYFGDLSALFSLIVKYLSQDGLWIFTIENLYQQPYQLTQSARYAHSPDYISQLCDTNGFSIVHSENIQLRTQQKDFIDGMIFVLRNTTC